MTTWYGHLLKSAIQQGSMVKRGELIGYVGNSGRSTGSHLHYTVLLNGVPVNPRRYLN
jgi:murein DD-endopeptidase MepM/ murein hydrolase activator NlpD